MDQPLGLGFPDARPNLFQKPSIARPGSDEASRHLLQFKLRHYHAGQHDGVDPIDQGTGSEQLGFAAARRAAADVDRSYSGHSGEHHGGPLMPPSSSACPTRIPGTSVIKLRTPGWAAMIVQRAVSGELAYSAYGNRGLSLRVRGGAGG